MSNSDPDADRRAAVSPLFKVDQPRPPSSSVRVTIGARSHHGVVRESNEDHYLVLRLGRDQETLATSLPDSDVPPPFKENAYAMLVADGLGAGGAGSVASRVALSTLAHLALDAGEWNVRITPDIAARIFDRAEWFYAQADSAIHTRAASSPLLKGMATALTAAYSAGTELFVAHVGHSRAYLFRGGELVMLTRDHTVEEHLAHSTRPTPVERRAQDARHILTDAVGAPGGHPLVEVERFHLRDGDCVLLCTNGLTDMLDDEKIAEVLTHRRAPDDQCEMLIDLANRAGGGDNITVVIAEYHIEEA